MNNLPKQNDEITIKELLNKAKDWYAYLLTQRKTIVMATAIGATIGLTYSLVKKPIYTATLTFALEGEKSGGGFGEALGLVSYLGLDMGGGGMFSGSNLTELFKSRSMVEQTLLTPVKVEDKIISLAEMYIQINDLRDKWDNNPKFKNIQFLPNTNRKYFTRTQDSILGVIYENISKNGLTVSQKDKKISIITIDFIFKNELFAMYFTEMLTKKVSGFYVETKSKKAQINLNILERQTDSIRNELNRAISGVAVANDNNFGLNPAMNVRRVTSVNKQVDVEANTLIFTELVKQTELSKVTLRKERPLIQVIDRPILPLPKERFGKLRGLLIGGFLAGFFMVFGLIMKRVIKEL